LTADFRESLKLESKQELPKDLGKSRKSLDEKNVQACYSLVKSWGNPFEQSEHLYSLFPERPLQKK
jgi:biotin operon repressor